MTDSVSGQPLAGASIYVHLLAACPTPGGSGSPTTVTGMITRADGTYRTVVIKPGTYLMRANRSGGSATTIRWWVNEPTCRTSKPLVLDRNLTEINFAVPPN